MSAKTLLVQRVLAAVLTVISLFCVCAHAQGASEGRRPLAERFGRLDRNGDGFVTAQEARGLPQFSEMDADRDGKVALDEVRAWYRKQRQTDRQLGATDGVLPKDAVDATAIFRLAYIHNGSLAQASALVDAFGNGRPDILIACKRQVHLVRNDGEGSFAHAETYMVDNANGWGAHDFNADGRLDAFVAQQQRRQDDCWINNGDGTFARRNLGNETVGNTRNVLFADFDGDGRPDVVTAAYADLGYQEGERGGIGQQWVEQQNRGLFVLHNRSTPGRIRFSEVARQAIGEYAHGNTRNHWNCYSVVPLDYDRDGDPDLLVGAVTRRYGGQPEDTRCVGLYENVSRPGEIRFLDRTRAVDSVPLASRSVRGGRTESSL
jgi:hypothetical protein